MNTLTEAIKQYQEKNNLSDQKFAKSIGIDPGNWSRTKRGLIKPQAKFLKALVSKIPELQLAVMNYMAEGEK